MVEYSFQGQLSDGEKGEQQLDDHFGKWFHITPVTMNEQRQGIDRKYQSRKDGRRLLVEYKTDYTASKTGNAFVETVSVDTANKPGWAYTSQSDMLLYYLPGDLLIYCIRLKELRKHLKRWNLTCQTRKIPNNGYHTHGLLVPLSEFEGIAEAVISL